MSEKERNISEHSRRKIDSKKSRQREREKERKRERKREREKEREKERERNKKRFLTFYDDFDLILA